MNLPLRGRPEIATFLPAFFPRPPFRELPFTDVTRENGKRDGGWLFGNFLEVRSRSASNGEFLAQFLAIFRDRFVDVSETQGVARTINTRGYSENSEGVNSA